MNDNGNPLRICLAGNPNCGKTTIFNALTGLRQRVGNYPGVTVEKKTGSCAAPDGTRVEITDLPGTYSLTARSPDEAVARDVLLGRVPGTGRPDCVVCVVDAANLERNLYLVSQLLELKVPTVLALNMVDAAQKSGIAVDAAALSGALGIPVVATVGTSGEGLDDLLAAARSNRAVPPAPDLGLPAGAEEVVSDLAARLEKEGAAPAGLGRSEALLRLAGRAGDPSAAADFGGYAPVEFSGALVGARMAWVRLAARLAARRVRPDDGGFTAEIDRVALHPVLGWAVFFGVMGAMFWAIFSLAETPMGWIESLVSWLRGLASSAIPEGLTRSLVTDGVLGGVGGVVVFLPQIVLLFLFLGILEDTGYMARAAFVVDRLMSRVGLPGRAFIPLLSCFACAIPGILAARVIDNRRDRLLTIFVAPFMSCSARLPVYILLVGLLLPAGNFPDWARAAAMTALYAAGIFGALALAWAAKKTVLRGRPSALLLEMPPYRWPTWKSMLIRCLERASMFVRKAGTVILAITVVMWAGMTFPLHPSADATPAQKLEYSLAGRAGKFVEPAIAPLGYDWKIGVGILSSFAAREVFVGTMKMIYDLGGDADDARLADAMRADRRADGSPLYGAATCLSLLAFYAYALQCGSTLVVAWRETGTWKWPALQFASMGAVAWVAAFAAYRAALLFLA